MFPPLSKPSMNIRRKKRQKTSSTNAASSLIVPQYQKDACSSGNLLVSDSSKPRFHVEPREGIVRSSPHSRRIFLQKWVVEASDSVLRALTLPSERTWLYNVDLLMNWYLLPSQKPPVGRMSLVMIATPRVRVETQTYVRRATR